jgi:hypothetical protein
MGVALRAAMAGAVDRMEPGSRAPHGQSIPSAFL